jgi:putative transposase
MTKSRFSERQIAFILRQADEGTTVEEVCRKAGSARRPTTIGARSTEQELAAGLGEGPERLSIAEPRRPAIGIFARVAALHILASKYLLRMLSAGCGRNNAYS